MYTPARINITYTYYTFISHTRARVIGASCVCKYAEMYTGKLSSRMNVYRYVWGAMKPKQITHTRT